MVYRVYQWASGTVGRNAALAVLRRSDLALVGLHAVSPGKVGRDVGELLGVERLGIAATGDVDAILHSAADVVIHAPLASLVYGDDPLQDLDDVCRLLAGGKNVITVVGYLHPKVHGDTVVRRIEDACRRGRSTFHSSGLNPGWMGDLLPLTMSALSRDIERIVVREISNFQHYPSPEIMFDSMGFGSTPERFEREGARRRRWLDGLFAESVQIVADGIGLALDGIESGAVAGQRWRWSGRSGGEARIVHETIWRMHERVAPHWPTGKHTVSIEGTPRMTIALDANWISDGLLATAAHAVNAVPYVCRAEPGIKTFLDLPWIFGRA
jgi:hypothetical protein